jgi:hypothetical protein
MSGHNMNPKVTSIEGIRDHNGRRVSLIGRYSQQDIRKYKRRDAPVYVGCASIVLSDGTAVLLYPVWHEANIRTAEEIKRFEDKTVTVRGKVYEVAPQPETGEIRENLLMPCIMDIQSIVEGGG